MTKERPLDLYVGEITTGIVTKEELIPFAVAIQDGAKYKGYLSSAFVLKKLTERLWNYIEDNNINNIELIKPDGGGNNGNNIDNGFTFFNIVSYAFKNKPLMIYQPLESYPLIIRAEINCYHLSREIGRSIFICICFFILFNTTIYYILVLNNRIYKKPFYTLRNMLLYNTNLPSNIVSYINVNELCPNAIVDYIKSIINKSFELTTSLKELKSEKASRELRKNVLDLVMLNDYRYNVLWNDHAKANCVYLNTLKSMVNMKAQSSNFVKILERIVGYCLEYFDEFNITLDIDNSLSKRVFLKYQVLTETIFSILTSISRMDDFCTENSINLKAHTTACSNIPKIIIEVHIDEFCVPPAGWNFGEKYTCTSLLATYLLAKENNFFFFIEKKENKVLFTLEPYSEDKYLAVNNLFEKYVTLADGHK